MGRLIDADKLKSEHNMKDDCAECDKELRGTSKACEFDKVYTKMDFCGWIDDAPTVDAAPVAHSEWIPKEKADTPYGLEMECVKCGFSVIVNDALYFNFCPNCGAKMDGKEDGSHEQRGEKAQKGAGAGAPEVED